MKWKSTLGTIVIVALLVGRVYLRGGFQWGPTNIEVIEAYQPKFASLHANLSDVADRVAAQPPVERVEISGELLPRPVLQFDHPAAANTSMIALLMLQTYQQRSLSSGRELTPEDKERLRFSMSEFDDFSSAVGPGTKRDQPGRSDPH